VVKYPKERDTGGLRHGIELRISAAVGTKMTP
jgi:hypothetical protein